MLKNRFSIFVGRIVTRGIFTLFILFGHKYIFRKFYFFKKRKSGSYGIIAPKGMKRVRMPLVTILPTKIENLFFDVTRSKKE